MNQLMNASEYFCKKTNIYIFRIKVTSFFVWYTNVLSSEGTGGGGGGGVYLSGKCRTEELLMNKPPYKWIKHLNNYHKLSVYIDTLCVIFWAGLRDCYWPGRTQTIYARGVTYYLDGAHTADSIQVTNWGCLFVVVIWFCLLPLLVTFRLNLPPSQT